MQDQQDDEESDNDTAAEPLLATSIIIIIISNNRVLYPKKFTITAMLVDLALVDIKSRYCITEAVYKVHVSQYKCQSGRQSSDN